MRFGSSIKTRVPCGTDESGSQGKKLTVADSESNGPGLEKPPFYGTAELRREHVREG